MKKLLVVDDDHIFHYIIKTRLRRSDRLDATYFFDGVQFTSYLERSLIDEVERPDVILLDLHMAGMDGWRLLEAIEALYPLFGKPVAVYVVSASVDPDVRKRALAFPFVKDFMCKPITREFFEMVSQSSEDQCEVREPI